MARDTLSAPLIRVAGAGVRFGERDPWVFRGVSLEVARAESVSIIGPSGSGKSVLLRLIAGLASATEGRVEVSSDDVGMLFQRNALFDSLTVEDNLLFPLRERKGVTGEPARARAAEMLRAVGLAGNERLHPDELSGGMQKRLGIARALIVEPEILLYDEPTAGLDPITSRTIADLIRQLRARSSTTIVCVTNDVQRAYQIGDRVCLLARGRLLDGGTPTQVQESRDPALRQFIYGLSEGPLHMSIRFAGVSKHFGPAKSILRDVSFEVASGEILFILGRSGMGKSVTLKHMVGILKPDAGEVHVDGLNVSRMDEDGLAGVRRVCGMVFQHPALLDSLDVYDNVAFGLRTPQYRLSLPKPLTAAEERAIVLEKLRLVHLDETILSRMPAEISYGMQKRVSLARTLAPSPRYLLFDEPTTGLDPINTNAVNALIQELSRRLQVTSVVVSHDMACALKIADRILVLEQARILSLGTVPETIARGRSEPLIRDFLAETLALLPPGERARLGLSDDGPAGGSGTPPGPAGGLA